MSQVTEGTMPVPGYWTSDRKGALSLLIGSTKNMMQHERAEFIVEMLEKYQPEVPAQNILDPRDARIAELEGTLRAIYRFWNDGTLTDRCALGCIGDMVKPYAPGSELAVPTIENGDEG